jgi:NTE family protein
LQGGGAHGAFVWGVLDCLLEDGSLAIDAISATSAGAMNGVVLASGLAEGGNDAARSRLREFWSEVARMERVFSAAWSGLDQIAQAFGLPPQYQPSHAIVHAMTHTLPPQLLNPLNFNPLKSLLLRIIDFERMNRSEQAPRLFLNATNVRTGKIKIFESPSISVDAVLASACLPPFFQAVEVDGEHYWDGGYLGNPAIFPLIYRRRCHDVVIVQITPIRRDELPQTAADVMHRMNEISFNSSLMREMRAIAFTTKLIDDRELDETRHHRMFMHWIGNDSMMAKLDAMTQIHADWSVLCHLFEEGRKTAREWLARHAEHVGRRSTIDLSEMFL